jgi:hypothetical protein
VHSVDATSFAYDANGNQVKREGNAIPNGYQRIDYNDFSMPYRHRLQRFQYAVPRRIDRRSKRACDYVRVHRGSIASREAQSNGDDPVLGRIV